MSESTLTTRLNESPWRRQLVDHEFFERVRSHPIDKGQVALFLGQWWHPLHYFPTFLSRCVSVLPDIESKTAVSKILYQETGEGDPQRAHEIIYADTLVGAGFTRDEATQSPAYPETRALVAGYEKASAERFAALGFIFATEASDLAMVSGLGTAIERVTGKRELEWVNIHVQQEPDHVEEADNTMLRSFGADEEALVMSSAAEMWRLWVGFFDRLLSETFHAGR